MNGRGPSDNGMSQNSRNAQCAFIRAGGQIRQDGEQTLGALLGLPQETLLPKVASSRRAELQPRNRNLNALRNRPPAMLSRKVDEGPVFAKMIEIDKMNGRWGDRLCITFDIDRRRTRLFGSAKQLASPIDAAGYTVRPENIVAGQRLDVPCLVTTKPSDDGKYVNIEQVFAYNPQRGQNAFVRSTTVVLRLRPILRANPAGWGFTPAIRARHSQGDPGDVGSSFYPRAAQAAARFVLYSGPLGCLPGCDFHRVNLNRLGLSMIYKCVEAA